MMKRFGVLILTLGIGIFSCSTEEIAPSKVQSSQQMSKQTQQLDLATSYSCSNLLIDATHDGGVWWYPQYGTYDPASTHQGRGLANYLRQAGFAVTELPRELNLSKDILKDYHVIIRVGGFGSYSTEEIEAYKTALDGDAKVILLGDHMNHNPGDELAEALGLTLSGIINGDITDFSSDDLFNGVTTLPYIAGAALISQSPDFESLARMNGQTVACRMSYNSNRFVAIGDSNMLETVPQPFTDNLIEWISQGCDDH